MTRLLLAAALTATPAAAAEITEAELFAAVDACVEQIAASPSGDCGRSDPGSTLSAAALGASWKAHASAHWDVRDAPDVMVRGLALRESVAYAVCDAGAPVQVWFRSEANVLGPADGPPGWHFRAAPLDIPHPGFCEGG